MTKDKKSSFDVSLTKMIETQVHTHGWCQSPLRFLMYNNFPPIDPPEAVGSSLLFVFGKDDKVPAIVVKLTRDLVSLHKEYETLNTMQRVLQDLTPKPLFFERYSDLGLIGMSHLPGNRLSNWNEKLGVLQAVVDQLLSCHLKLPGGEMPGMANLPQSDQAYEALKTINGSSQFFDQAVNLWKSVYSALENVALPCISQHGDFCFINLLFHERQIFVLDWEDFGEITVPAYDFFCLLLNFYEANESGQGGAKFFQDRNFLQQSREGLNRYFLGVGIPHNLSRKLFEFTLIQQFLYSSRKKRSSSKLFGQRLVEYIRDPERFSDLLDE